MWLGWAGTAVCSTLAGLGRLRSLPRGRRHAVRDGHQDCVRADVRVGQLSPQSGRAVTEAVVKEIELRTPFKVVSTPDADSILSGKITTESKRLVIESPTDEGREVEVNLRVHVTCQPPHRRVCVREENSPCRRWPTSPSARATCPRWAIGGPAHEKAIRDLAAQIVN